MGRTTISKYADYERLIAINVLTAVLDIAGLKKGFLTSQLTVGATIGETTHKILKELEKKYASK
ncbi:MAG: hypothetical protein WC356_06800 [Candidatus Micrarchaeia archaeon]|jgi:hypothetical protein